FSMHALKAPDFRSQLRDMIARGAQVLLTSNLVAARGHDLDASLPNVHVLDVKYEPGREGQRNHLDWDAFMSVPQAELDRLRDAVLAPLGVTFHAPSRVALYLIGRHVMVENFNDEPVDASLRMPHIRGARAVLVLPPEASVECEVRDNLASLRLPPRSLVTIALGP
ncbi:MAG: hypothetical protein ACE5O2_15405, partial [Armatimonadota bacterium]